MTNVTQKNRAVRGANGLLRRVRLNTGVNEVFSGSGNYIFLEIKNPVGVVETQPLETHGQGKFVSSACRE